MVCQASPSRRKPAGVLPLVPFAPGFDDERGGKHERSRNGAATVPVDGEPELVTTKEVVTAACRPSAGDDDYGLLVDPGADRVPSALMLWAPMANWANQ